MLKIIIKMKIDGTYMQEVREELGDGEGIAGVLSVVRVEPVEQGAGEEAGRGESAEGCSRG